MGLDWTWLLLGLPLAFALGWGASRFDFRQLRLENRRAPKAYFRGLNHLLNDKQDQAIDAFIEAVEIDPDASELHFALGRLFRSKGDYERAVRVHEHLIARGDVSSDDRLRAQHALAQDYWKAGLLDRTQTAYEALLGTRFELDARIALLAVFERGRDWAAAIRMARDLRGMALATDSGTIEPATRQLLASLDGRMAHYLCEQAHGADAAKAFDLLAEATTLAPTVSRAWVERARLESTRGQPASALDAFFSLAKHSPQNLPLVACEMVELAKTLAATDSTALTRVLDLIRNANEAVPAIDLMQALANGADSADAARAEFMSHLDRKPSLIAATRWMAQERLEHEQFHPQVQRALDQAVMPLQRYRCVACGFVAQQHFWQCPGCQTWDGLPAKRVEEL